MKNAELEDMASLEADYIIVGAGSAGCVLANRLSENTKNRVVLIEAGGSDWHPWIHVPIGYGKLFKHRTLNWMYESQPQVELNGRRIFQPRGKVLGGSSSINGLVYIRGQSSDFDHWRQLGNEGWSYQDVLPFFRKAEDQVRGCSEYHGVGGPLCVSDATEPHPLCDSFIAAAAQVGIRRNSDFNGLEQEGAGYFQTTSRRGMRWSTARGYLRPAKRRSNLKVITHALVSSLVMDGLLVKGVRYRRDNTEYSIRARREVILSGGAFNSPQLLQLSGIGPAALLKEHGIVVRRDLRGVGESLQDHLQVRTVLRTREPITINDSFSTLRGRSLAGLRWALTRKGPLTISAGYAGAFFRTRSYLTSPDVQVHFITFSTDKMGENLHPFSALTASICQLRPESRGYVRIRTADPCEPPLINPNYLSTETDRQTNVEGLKRLREILAAPAMTARVTAEHLPGPDVKSDDELLAYCRETASSIYHPSCTCRMGSDNAAVVDARLRVRGVEGLRVVDGSIMPAVVSGNTNAAIIMIAEKASQMIEQDARNVLSK